MEFDDEMNLLAEVLYNAISLDRIISKNMFDEYPELFEQEITKEFSLRDISSLCKKKLKNRYEENLEKINDKIKYFSEEWEKKKEYLLSNLQNELDIECNIDIITIKVGNVALCPRWLEEKSFYVPTYYDNFSEIALHECCHFIYFEKWKQIYDIKDESIFEYPNLEWVLSEAIIDPILGKSIYEDEVGKKIKAYDVFYNIKIGKKNLIECLRTIYNQNKSIEIRLKMCFNFFCNNKKEIMKHINEM